MLSDLFCRSDRATTQRYFSTIALVAISLCCGSAFADDWATLFDGKSLDGWKPSRDNTQFAIADGVIVGTSSGQTQFLHTVETYGDFELELEVKLHDTDLNSGIQIRTQLTRTNDERHNRGNRFTDPRSTLENLRDEVATSLTRAMVPGSRPKKT